MRGGLPYLHTRFLQCLNLVPAHVPGQILSMGLVATKRVKGSLASRRRGHAFRYTDRNASSIEIPTVLSGNGLPFLKAAVISVSDFTENSPLVSILRCASNWLIRILVEGYWFSPNL